MKDDHRSRFVGALAGVPVFDQHPDRFRPTHASLPTLFGRFTAILSRTPRLALTLRRLRQMCSVLASDPTALSGELHPPSLTEDLGHELALHFAAEEADGYYGVIIEERPSLLPRVSELEREHAVLLGAVEALCGMSTDGSRRRELGTRTLRLLEAFESHDRCEQRLLRDLLLAADAQGSAPSGTYKRAGLCERESPLLVLVVDDDRAVRVVVRRTLEEAGCVVVEAADAASALQVLGERQSAVDAIVSDVGLPGMLGSELVRAAREICPNIATLLMSGDAPDELVAAGRVTADAEVLEKPFLPGSMLARLAAALERRR